MTQGQVCGSFNNHCVERGISTMRLALGYDEPLPKNWPTNIRKRSKQLAQLCGLAFPDREVQVWLDYKGAYKLPKNVTFAGTYYKYKDRDDCLAAFTYGAKESDFSHFVVGVPCFCGIEEVQFIMLVSLTCKKEDAE